MINFLKSKSTIKNILLASIIISLTASSCKKYLDIVPDNVATIDNAFSLRSTAKRYLFTCYSFLPYGLNVYNSLLLTGGELGVGSYYPGQLPQAYGIEVAMGNQNANDPYLNFWDGRYTSGKNLWIAIRDCNIFLNNIEKVPDMETLEKKQWSSEVQFLKAYYYFYLLRMYGPIPIMKKNIPVYSPLNKAQLKRQPVDSVFNYIIRLLDSAAVNLLPKVEGNDKLGRITLPIDKAFKAKVLVYQASPLFNGNSDYKSFTDKDGIHLFSQSFDESKWEKAALACKTAIDLCNALGYELYTFQSSFNLSDTTVTKMSIRNSFAEAWNKEIIWADPDALSYWIQRYSMVRWINPAANGNSYPLGHLSVTLNFAKLFYTNHGLPIREDKTWDYAGRFNTRIAKDSNKFNIKEGYETANFNFNRGPRFYADLGVDGGIWYGDGKYNDDDSWHLELRREGLGNDPSDMGITPKKYVYYKDVVNSSSGGYIKDYPWVIMRLAGLYLLYAEAANEANDHNAAIYYLNLVRHRAGLPDVRDSWDNYSRHPGKYKTKDGLREIIHRERVLELALEGQRVWDVRRWKTAINVLNTTIYGWDTEQESPKLFYRKKAYRQIKFKFRDYFWPIRQYDLQVDPNLIQNPGW